MYFNALGLVLAVISAGIQSAAFVKLHQVIEGMRTRRCRPTDDRALALVKAMMVAAVIGYAWQIMALKLRLPGTACPILAALCLLTATLTYAMIRAMADLEAELKRREHEIMKTLVNAIEMKDTYTRGHSEHVYNIVRLFCAHLHRRRIRTCDPRLMDAALLHDIGKIGVTGHILNKQEALTDEEWQIMRSHPEAGKRLLDDACFGAVGDWVRYHHERMDGRGYLGLPGERIPVEARIIAIADTYSALTTDRAYRPGMAHMEAAEVMRRAAGAQLDAELTARFLEIPERELAGCRP